MFGIGMSEMVIILAVALLVFGPNKLPDIAKQIAKGLKELRKAGDDLRSSVNFDLDDDRPARPRPMPQRSETWKEHQQAQQQAQNAADNTPAAIPGSALADGLPRPQAAHDAVPQSGPAAEASSEPSTSASPGTDAEKAG